jgi:colanic acid/amylovoran biosynthesis protein
VKIYLDALSKHPTISVGMQALIIGSMEIVSKRFKDVEFVLLSYFPEIDRAYLDKEPFKVKIVKRRSNQLKTIKDVRRIVGEVDCVVSNWGDGYISTPPHKMLQKTFFLKHRKKSLVLFPSSIGPFKGELKRLFSYFGLQKFDQIMIRDTFTFNYIKDLGLNNLHLIPDTAFILEAVDSFTVEKLMKADSIPVNTSYIGLNVSQLLNNLFKSQLRIDYPKFMAELVNYLNTNFKGHILLIPHQFIPSFFQQEKQYYNDDRVAIREIMQVIGNKARVAPLLGEYSCRELKGIIGRCEIFIGGRMHSVIGALSMGVPSVLMQYSHKAIGVMDLLGLKEFVWSIDSLSEELFEKIHNLWQNRSKLRQQIDTEMVKVKKDALRAGEILENSTRNYTAS